MRGRDSKSLVDTAHDKLHRLITDGNLAEGQRLIIDQLAREFEISLIPLREALARLHAEGLVTFERNKGYRVAPPLTHEQLRMLFEARSIIETGAAELAIERSNGKAIKTLRNINRQIAVGEYGHTFRSSRRFVKLNESFHVELVELARNPQLSSAYRHLGYHQQITRPTFDHGVGDIVQIVREHDAIIDALANHDAEALRQAIRIHIDNGLDFLSQDLKPPESRSRQVTAPATAVSRNPSTIRARRRGQKAEA